MVLTFAYLIAESESATTDNPAIRQSIEFRHLDHANIYIDIASNDMYKNFINAVKQTLRAEHPGVPLKREYFATIYVNEYAL